MSSVIIKINYYLHMCNKLKKYLHLHDKDGRLVDYMQRIMIFNDIKELLIIQMTFLTIVIANAALFWLLRPLRFGLLYLKSLLA